MIFDYENLRLIWWLLLGVLADRLRGHGWLRSRRRPRCLPFVGRSDIERRIAINTIGPVWEGNQVWLMLGGGAIFAAWPPLYAVSFSGFYLAMFLVLVSLILRPVGFTFRSKLDNPVWRSFWDWALVIGGAVPALVFGVAVGNALQGRIPSPSTPTCAPATTSRCFACSIPSPALRAGQPLHAGDAWRRLPRREGERTCRGRARQAGGVAAMATLVLFALAGARDGLPLQGYAYPPRSTRPARPIRWARRSCGRPAHGWRTTERIPGCWRRRRSDSPAPLLAVFPFQKRRACGDLARDLRLGRGHRRDRRRQHVSVPAAFVTSLPSSLTVWDASSSRLTLGVMLAAAVIFVPIVFAYTGGFFAFCAAPSPPPEIHADPHGVY